MAVVINGTTGITAPGTETFGDGTALGGATNPIVSMAKGANNYVQGYIVNNTDAANASADLVAYPSNGTDSSGWVDMGITGPTFSQAAFSVTGPNEAYLFGSAPSGAGKTGNLVIATDSTGTANAIQFYTGGFNQAKSATRMVIDGAGNVGIGTSSPNFSGYGTTNLTVFGGTTIQGVIELVGTRVDGDGFAAGDVNFFSNANSAGNKRIAQIQAITNGATANNRGGALLFSTKADNGSVIERARIDSSGNLLVGTTSNSINPTGNGFVFLPNYSGIYAVQTIAHASGAGTGAGFHNFTYNGGSVGSITQNGTTGVLYNLTSDYRLKNDPQPLTGAKDFVMALQPKKWQWWDGSGEGVGFIAHEFMEVAKYSGNGEKDAVDENGNPVYQSIQPSSSEVMANLVSLLQEQQAIIEQLRADVETLKAK